MHYGRTASDWPTCNHGHGFTLIELLVVLSISLFLAGVALPVLAAVRVKAEKVSCASNLRQIGITVGMYNGDNMNHYPLARHMPPPFFSIDPDPPLPQYLSPYIAPSWPVIDRETMIYHCKGDVGYVFDRASSSYQYQILLGGQPIEEYLEVRHLGESPSTVWVLRDFDGGTFETNDGWLAVPMFHGLRNLLFADGHAGNY